MHFYHLIKISARFLLADIDKLILKFIWKYTSRRIANTTLKKDSKLEEITLPDSKVLNQYHCAIAKGIDT